MKEQISSNDIIEKDNIINVRSHFKLGFIKQKGFITNSENRVLK
jgi:hypothetical protein